MEAGLPRWRSTFERAAAQDSLFSPTSANPRMFSRKPSCTKFLESSADRSGCFPRGLKYLEAQRLAMDVGMVQSGRGFGFLHEAALALRIGQSFGRKRFQRVLSEDERKPMGTLIEEYNPVAFFCIAGLYLYRETLVY